MDIISHGLWGSIAFGRKNRRQFWQAFLFGIMPDALSFGPYFIAVLLGLSSSPGFHNPKFGIGHPPARTDIPNYVHVLYQWTHSIIIFAVVFLLLWLIFRRPILTVSAWGLHILMDIFTHSNDFFPTPFLWPISDFHVNGLNWGQPIILLPDVILLVILYVWFFAVRKRVKNKPCRPEVFSG